MGVEEATGWGPWQWLALTVGLSTAAALHSAGSPDRVGVAVSGVVVGVAIWVVLLAVHRT